MTLFSAVLISVCEPLNHIHQDTKSARLIAVCKRSITLNKFGKRVRGSCVHVFLVYCWTGWSLLARKMADLAHAHKKRGHVVPPSCPSVPFLFCANTDYITKNMHARRACVYRWTVRNVFLARHKCWRCNKTECIKRCAIFVVLL